MTQARRNHLRQVMQLAWGLFRADRTRGFADALRGAWAYLKRLAATPQPRWARGGRTVQFRSPIRSPMDRTRGGDFASTRDGSAKLTSWIGR